MCGIAGIIYRDGTHEIGRDMTRMLQSMKHRGPDSTGYALYGRANGDYVMRYTLADANDPRDFEFDERIDRHQRQVLQRLGQMGLDVKDVEEETDYAYRLTFESPNGDMKAIADRIEDVGDAESVSHQYRLEGGGGGGAIGHVRMATESDVDISGAHPYWAYPFSDVAVVHNGQLTNYHHWKRRL